MKINLLRPIILVGATVLLLSCAGTTTAPTYLPQMMGIEGVTVVGTGKTISDHVVSFATGKNCSTARKNTGKHYCEEDEIAVPDEVFCYNTLGDVTCYASPAPHGENQRHLGQTPDARGGVR